MSYEGYEQILCKNGHYTEIDCYVFEFEEFVCHHCGAGVGWSRGVDQTNDNGSPIDMAPFLKAPAIYEACPTCDHKKMVAPDVYNIPE